MSDCIIVVDHAEKRFGEQVALRDVSVSFEAGKIHGIIGRNGSGKTVLFKCIVGLMPLTSGSIQVNGRHIETGKTVPDDIGAIIETPGFLPNYSGFRNLKFLATLRGRIKDAEIRKAMQQVGLDPESRKHVGKYSLGMRQRLGIAQAIMESPDILILDEPTAVLTPQETDKLFAVMRNMKNDGKSLIIITHKLHEVLDVSDRVAVLRKGEYIGDVMTKDANQQSLTDMMVGHSVTLNINRPDPVNVTPRLEVKDLTVYDELGVKRLDNVTFTINAGEVLGIAGIAGSGQRELLESIAGLYPIKSGSVLFHNPETGEEKDLVGLDPMDIRKSGIAMSFVPEDRLGMGLVGSMGMTGNMMLRSWRKGKGVFLNRKDPEALAQRIWQELEVVTPSTNFPVRRMSGGNVQKVLVGREIAQQPSVLMTAYAVRGLDINTSYTIYNLLTEQKMKGVAVVYVGEDLDVLLELCDRIVVLCGGQVSGVVDARKTDKREVGALMTRMEGGKEDA
mgnify:CR=1 FL=1